MEEIEHRSDRLDERTKSGAEAWDQATLTVLQRTAEMESALGKGTEQLLTAADKAADKTKEIENSLDHTYESLNDTVDQISSRLY